MPYQLSIRNKFQAGGDIPQCKLVQTMSTKDKKVCGAVNMPSYMYHIRIKSQMQTRNIQVNVHLST